MAPSHGWAVGKKGMATTCRAVACAADFGKQFRTEPDPGVSTLTITGHLVGSYFTSLSPYFVLWKMRHHPSFESR